MIMAGLKPQTDCVRALGNEVVGVLPERIQQLLGWRTRTVASLGQHDRPTDKCLRWVGQDQPPIAGSVVCQPCDPLWFRAIPTERKTAPTQVAPMKRPPSAQFRHRLSSLCVTACLILAAAACSAEGEDDPDFKAGSSSGTSGSSSGATGTRDWTSTPGAVIDKATNFMWQRKVENQKRTWQEAKDYCKALVLAGLDDWRLPHKDELCTIVDITTTTPSIDDKAFPDTPPKPFWTATKHVTAGHAYGIDFEDASSDCGTGIAAYNIAHYARCMR
jgi:hypothetical protein